MKRRPSTVCAVRRVRATGCPVAAATGSGAARGAPRAASSPSRSLTPCPIPRSTDGQTALPVPWVDGNRQIGGGLGDAAGGAALATGEVQQRKLRGFLRCRPVGNAAPDPTE